MYVQYELYQENCLLSTKKYFNGSLNKKLCSMYLYNQSTTVKSYKVWLKNVCITYVVKFHNRRIYIDTEEVHTIITFLSTVPV